MHVVVNVRKSTLVLNEERVKFISSCPLRISLFVLFLPHMLINSYMGRAMGFAHLWRKCPRKFMKLHPIATTQSLLELDLWLSLSHVRVNKSRQRYWETNCEIKEVLKSSLSKERFCEDEYYEILSWMVNTNLFVFCFWVKTNLFFALLYLNLLKLKFEIVPSSSKSLIFGILVLVGLLMLSIRLKLQFFSTFDFFFFVSWNVQ